MNYTLTEEELLQLMSDARKTWLMTDEEKTKMSMTESERRLNLRLIKQLFERKRGDLKEQVRFFVENNNYEELFQKLIPLSSDFIGLEGTFKNLKDKYGFGHIDKNEFSKQIIVLNFEIFRKLKKISNETNV